MEVPLMQFPPGDPRVVDRIASQLKSQGIFDQFRKECISDVDTKPAYQNLHQRVEGTVTSFLANQEWRPDLNKNQLRDSLRKHIHESGFLDIGLERIVDQVVNPKIMTVFLPQIEDVVYHCLGIEKPKRGQETQTGPVNPPPSNATQKLPSLKDLLPTDLDPISPESDGLGDKDDLSENEYGKEEENGAVEEEEEGIEDEDDVDNEAEEEEEDEEEVSPPFEPIEEVTSPCDGSSADSHLSGMSDLTSHDSQVSETSFGVENHITSAKIPIIDLSNHDSQLSKVSSGSRLSIAFSDDQKPPSSPPEIDITNDESQMSKLSLQICQESQGSSSAETPDQLNKESKNAECIVVKDSSSDTSNLDTTTTTTTSSSKSPSIIVCDNDRMKVISEDDTQEMNSRKTDIYAEIEQIEKKHVPEKDNQKEGKVRSKTRSENDVRKNENVGHTSGSERRKSDKHHRGRSDSKYKTARSGRHGEKSSKSDDRHDEKKIRKDKTKTEAKNDRNGNLEQMKYEDQEEDSTSYKNKSKYSDHERDTNGEKIKYEEREDDSDDSGEGEGRVSFENLSDNEEMSHEESPKREENKQEESSRKLKYDGKKEIHKNKERESGKGKSRHEERLEKDRGKVKSEDRLEEEQKEKVKSSERIEKEGNKMKIEEKSLKEMSKERTKHGDKHDKDKEKSKKEKSRHGSKSNANKEKSKYDGKTEREGSNKHKTDDRSEREKDKSKLESRSRKDSSKERSKHSDKGDREKNRDQSKYDDKDKGSNKKKENGDEVDGEKKEKSRSETRKDKSEKSRHDDKSRSKTDSKHRDSNLKIEDGSSKHDRSRNRDSKHKDRNEGKENEKKKDEKSNKDRIKTDDKSSRDKSQSKVKENQDKKDRKQEDNESGKSFRDGDRKSKDNKKKDGKSKSVADDHHIHRDRDSDDRRSTDRDSSGTPHGRSVSSRRSGSSSHSSNHHDKKDSSSSGNQKSDGGGNSDSVTEQQPEDSSDQASVDLPYSKRSLEEDSDSQEEYSCVMNAGKLILKTKKPKIAANIFEARKIMQLRKSMAKIERKKLKELNKKRAILEKRCDGESSVIVGESSSDSDEPLLFFTEQEAYADQGFIEFVKMLEESATSSQISFNPSDESEHGVKQPCKQNSTEGVNVEGNAVQISTNDFQCNENKIFIANSSETCSEIKQLPYTNSSSNKSDVIITSRSKMPLFNRELRVSVENCLPLRRTSTNSNSGRNGNESDSLLKPVSEVQKLKTPNRRLSRDSESSITEEESVCDESVDRFEDHAVVNHSNTSEPVSHERYVDSTSSSSSSDDDDDDHCIQKNNLNGGRDGYSYARDYNNVERSSSDDEKGGDNMSLSNELILPALRDLMLESGFQLSDTVESADTVTSGMPTPDSQGEMSEKQSSAGSAGSASNTLERKRPKLGRSRRVGLSRPHPSKRLDVGRRVVTPPTPDADFVMPLSPESDVSASSVDHTQKVLPNSNDDSSLTETAKTTNHCLLEDATEEKRYLRSRSTTAAPRHDQVYNKGVLKPQPLFGLQENDHFPNTPVQEPTINCVDKRRRISLDSEVPQTSKRMRR